MSANKSENNDSINLLDFFKIFKKNLKLLYFFLALSVIISIAAVSINLSTFRVFF